MKIEIRKKWNKFPYAFEAAENLENFLALEAGDEVRRVKKATGSMEMDNLTSSPNSVWVYAERCGGVEELTQEFLAFLARNSRAPVARELVDMFARRRRAVRWLPANGVKSFWEIIPEAVQAAWGVVSVRDPQAGMSGVELVYEDEMLVYRSCTGSVLCLDCRCGVRMSYFSRLESFDARTNGLPIQLAETRKLCKLPYRFPWTRGTETPQGAKGIFQEVEQVVNTCPTKP